MLLEWKSVEDSGRGPVAAFRKAVANRKYESVMKQLEPIKKAHEADLVSIGVHFRKSKLVSVSVNLADNSAAAADDIPSTVKVGRAEAAVKVDRVNPETGLKRDAKILPPPKS